MDKIKDCLKFEFKFSVVAVSETWLCEDKELNNTLEDYDLFRQNRKHKKGRGVAIFVKRGIQCKVMDKMTFSIDELMECVTVEIRSNGKEKYID